MQKEEKQNQTELLFRPEFSDKRLKAQHRLKHEAQNQKRYHDHMAIDQIQTTLLSIYCKQISIIFPKFEISPIRSSPFDANNLER